METLSNGRSPSYFNLLKWLSMTAAAIEENGWTSRSKAQTSPKSATADIVSFQFFGDLKEDEEIEVTEEHEELATATILWIEQELSEKTNVSDYEWNLIKLVSDGLETFFKTRYSGYVSSMVMAYKRAKGLLEEKESQSDPNWKPSEDQGEIKNRQDWDLTVTEVKVIPNYSRYGPEHKFLYKMTDDSYNVFMWFTTKNTLEEGEQVTIKGTVKDHTEFNGVKQTVLTRCKKLERITA